MFGGGLPVPHHTVTARAKGMGDRSYKPYGLMFLNLIGLLDHLFMSVWEKARKTRGERRSMDIHENKSGYL